MPFGVRPQVAGAGERQVADHAHRRAQRLDRQLRRLQPGVIEPGAHEVDVGDDRLVQREDLGQRPAEPLLAGGRRDVAGHRPASLGHDVGERRVADVEVPQRRAGAGPRRAVAVQRQPGDQLERLGSLEAGRRVRRGRRPRPVRAVARSATTAGRRTVRRPRPPPIRPAPASARRPRRIDQRLDPPRSQDVLQSVAAHRAVSPTGTIASPSGSSTQRPVVPPAATTARPAASPTDTIATPPRRRAADVTPARRHLVGDG